MSCPDVSTVAVLAGQKAADGWVIPLCSSSTAMQSQSSSQRRPACRLLPAGPGLEHGQPNVHPRQLH